MLRLIRLQIIVTVRNYWWLRDIDYWYEGERSKIYRIVTCYPKKRNQYWINILRGSR